MINYILIYNYLIKYLLFWLFSMILNKYILSNKSREIKEMRDEFQLMYLAPIIVDGTFNFFKIEQKISNIGKPPFDLKNRIKLIFYGYINKITSTFELAYNAKYN